MLEARGAVVTMGSRRVTVEHRRLLNGQSEESSIVHFLLLIGEFKCKLPLWAVPPR